MNAAYRDDVREDEACAPTPVARDEKCTIRRVGGLNAGSWTIDVTTRTGRDVLLLLDIRDEHLTPRLREAQTSKQCIEITYEKLRASHFFEGRILAIS